MMDSVMFAKTVLLIVYYGFLQIGGGGLNELVSQVKRENKNVTVIMKNCYDAEVFSYKVLKRAQMQRIMLIGHSCGVNAALRTARVLDEHAIPVELLVSLDAPKLLPEPQVPGNVLVAISYTNHTLFSFGGSALTKAPNNQISIVLNYSTDTEHTAIPSSKKVQQALKKDIHRVASGIK